MKLEITDEVYLALCGVGYQSYADICLKTEAAFLLEIEPSCDRMNDLFEYGGKVYVLAVQGSTTLSIYYGGWRAAARMKDQDWNIGCWWLNDISSEDYELLRRIEC